MAHTRDWLGCLRTGWLVAGLSSVLSVLCNRVRGRALIEHWSGGVFFCGADCCAIGFGVWRRIFRLVVRRLLSCVRGCWLAGDGDALACSLSCGHVLVEFQCVDMHKSTPCLLRRGAAV